MKNIAVVGSEGKMGQLICEELCQKYEIVKIDKSDDIELAKDCELIVDFSTGENSAKTALWCKKYNKKLIIGATGQTNAENKLILEISKHIPLMKAGNFSLGISLIKQMLEQFKDVDVDSVAIFEKHHKNKKDSPSGTAIEMSEKIKQILKKDSQIAAFRNGEEIGTHEISIYLNGEVIKISHQAFSRKTFIDGLKLAIEQMLQKTQNGYYRFEKIAKYAKKW